MIPLSLLYKIDYWLRCHMLVWCIRCNRLMFAKNACEEITTTGLVATFCHDCRNKVYTPWGK
jgi:hypothetical protein